MPNVFPPLFALTDEQAMWRVQTQDDEAAFDHLVRRWEIPIRRLCTRMTGDEHRGEDLTQEAFTRLYARRKLYQPTAKFSTYLWRIALNLCHDELRRVKRRGEAPFDDDLESGALVALPAADTSPADRVVEQERARIVSEALLKLSDLYRSVVLLRHYENLKFREIAEVLGVPEGTVKSRMAEALTQLARWVGPCLEQPPCGPTKTARISDERSAS